MLLLDGELVLDVAAGGNFDRSLPHVAVGPLEVHAVVGIPAAHLVRVAADDELLAVAELLLDLELDLDRVGRGARADGERAGADRAALARAGEDAEFPSVFLENSEEREATVVRVECCGARMAAMVTSVRGENAWMIRAVGSAETRTPCAGV